MISVIYAASLRHWVPVSDEIEYLSFARSVAVAGVYASTPSGPEADTYPGREPAFPLLIAAAIRLHPHLFEMVVWCWPFAPSCGEAVSALRYVNAVLIALAAWFVFLTVRSLGGRNIAAVAAGLYILLNLQMNKTATHVISDYLALTAVALFGLGIARAMKSGGVRWWLVVGLALSLTVLTKSIYLLFAAAVVAGLAVGGMTRLRNDGVKAGLPVILVGAVLVGTVGGWYGRNIAHFGVVHDPRGAIALSTREVFNDMTAAENAAAFVWWTRGFGEKIARRYLPESSWRRHELYADDGFYMQGQVHRYEDRLRQLTAESDLGRAAAEQVVSGVIAHEMLANWPAYLATMPALFYRGLWFDEFIVFGFPALAWLVIRSIRRREFARAAALAGGVFSLVAYPALSLNIPRYQFTAAPALAVAAGFAIEALIQKWRGRGRRGSDLSAA